ncbi:MAG: hypothetical protein KAF91_13100 [Nostoc sp. TH1S01]|nr:hypothetical protein [Nostoc sp. TH1S01]
MVQNCSRIVLVWQCRQHYRQVDLLTHLYRISGVDFTTVDGSGALTVLVLLSEVGLAPKRFPNVQPS